MQTSWSKRWSRAAYFVCFASLALGVSRTAGAATIRVPADQPTIQQAINAAATGDTVLVSPGIYLEAIDFGGKIVSVISEQGPEVTIIDANGTQSAVTFMSGETRNAVISGFTIRGGRNIYSGAGVYVAFSSPTIRGNIVTGNRGCSGVGIYSYFSSPLIEGNTISQNAIDGCTGGWGIGVYVGGDSAARIIGNVISDNTGEAASGGGVALFAAGNAVLIGNVIARNATAGAAGCGWGGGVAIANFVQATIVDNLVVGNSACYGGAFHWRGSTGQTVLANNTIADNQAASWPSVYATGVDSRNQLYNNIIQAQNGPALWCDNASAVPPPVLDSNDVFSVQGPAYGGTCMDQTGANGNVSADPLFSDAANGNYQVVFGSPVVDAGNNSAPHIQPTDLAGNPRIASPSGSPDRIDIGAYEYFNRPPTADAGPDQTVTVGSDCVAPVTLNGTGFDPDGDELTFTWTSAVGTFTGPALTLSLPEGSHRFVLTVSDAKGGSTWDSVLVTVLDATPPSIGAVTATPNILSPANHELVPVVVSVSASDACGGTVSCRIVSVASDEPTTGLGGGDLGPDWQITGALTVNLRAERWKKGDGRVYTITVECMDESGNRSTSTVTVHVPRR
jgi:hypothetical protein